MANEMFFLPLLANALEQKDAKNALLKAFEEIQARGQQEAYRDGYRQFQHFMKHIQEYANLETTAEFKDETYIFKHLLYGPDGPAGLKKWLEEFDAAEEKIPYPTLLLMKDERELKRIPLDQQSGRWTIDNLQPGFYALSFDTGRVIWEGELTGNDLLWTHAFPGQDLRLAADTGEEAIQPSRQFQLLQGEIVLNVYPGLESGRIELLVNRPSGN